MSRDQSYGTLVTRRVTRPPRHTQEQLADELFRQLGKGTQDVLLYRAARQFTPGVANLSPPQMYNFYLQVLDYLAADDFRHWSERSREFRKWADSTGGHGTRALQLVNQLAHDYGRNALNAKAAERDAKANVNVDAIKDHRTPHAQKVHDAQLQDAADRRASIEAAMLKHSDAYLRDAHGALDRQRTSTNRYASDREKDIIAALDQLQHGITRVVEERTELRGGVDMQNDIRNAMEFLSPGSSEVNGGGDSSSGQQHEGANATDRA